MGAGSGLRAYGGTRSTHWDLSAAVLDFCNRRAPSYADDTMSPERCACGKRCVKLCPLNVGSQLQSLIFPNFLSLYTCSGDIPVL